MIISLFTSFDIVRWPQPVLTCMITHSRQELKQLLRLAQHLIQFSAGPCMNAFLNMRPRNNLLPQYNLPIWLLGTKDMMLVEHILQLMTQVEEKWVSKANFPNSITTMTFKITTNNTRIIMKIFLPIKVRVFLGSLTLNRP